MSISSLLRHLSITETQTQSSRVSWLNIKLYFVTFRSSSRVYGHGAWREVCHWEHSQRLHACCGVRDLPGKQINRSVITMPRWKNCTQTQWIPSSPATFLLFLCIPLYPVTTPILSHGSWDSGPKSETTFCPLSCEEQLIPTHTNTTGLIKCLPWW